MSATYSTASAASHAPAFRSRNATALGRARWASASLTYRYSDYLLDVGATTLPTGVSIYERYTSGRTKT